MHPTFKESTNADKFLKSIHITVEVSSMHYNETVIINYHTPVIDNKMKKQKYHFVGTIPESNTKL
jgi:hypothetical protein